MSSPKDQFLVIGKTPQECSWKEKEYRFSMGNREPFTWTKYHQNIFPFATRFFKTCHKKVFSDDAPFLVDTESNHRNSVPALKSQIQKAIRRCLTTAAVQAAWALMKQDPLELLRRLPIIMIEDKKIHQDLPLIVWGMLHLSNDKKWTLPTNFVFRVIHVVLDLVEDKDMPFFDFISGDAKQVDFSLNKETFALLDQSHKALVASLLIRADYGGTDGDVEMLRNYAFWFAKDKYPVIISSFGSRKTPLADMDMKSHWIPWTFDFHITDMASQVIDALSHAEIQSQLLKVVENVNHLEHLQYVKKTVWFYWSAVRFCRVCDATGSDCPHQQITPLGHKLKPFWEFIRPYVETFAKEAVERASGVKERKRKNDDKGHVNQRPKR